MSSPSWLAQGHGIRGHLLVAASLCPRLQWSVNCQGRADLSKRLPPPTLSLPPVYCLAAAPKGESCSVTGTTQIIHIDNTFRVHFSPATS